MATKSDVSGSFFEKVDGSFGAGRVSIWPQKSQGGYRYAGFSGLLTGVAAAGELFQFRWGSATHLCALKFLKVRMSVITGFTAAQELGFEAIASTGWTASGTGGLATAAASTNLKKRQSFDDSRLTDLRISTTAALTAGTKTLVNHAFLTCAGKTLAAAATVQDIAIEEALDMTNSGDEPYVFAQNEGFSVRNMIAMGAGGTVRMSLQAAWAEFAAADYPTI